MICPSRSCRKKYLIRAGTTDCAHLSGNDPKKLNASSWTGIAFRRIDAGRNSYLLTYPPLHFVVCRLGSWHASVFGPLPSQSSSGFWVYRLSPVLPSQLWSASISLSIYRLLIYNIFPRGITFSSPLHMSEPSQPLLSKEFRHRVHVCLTWSCLVFPLAHRSMRISVLCNFLSSFFPTAQHPSPYTMAGFIAVLYNLSFNFVGMFLSRITPVVSLHFDQAIFTLLCTSFSAPPLASNNEPRYLNVFTVFTPFSWM